MPSLIFGWIWILSGFLSGAAIGIFSHDTAWFGGYDSFRRRMVRLAHIACVALGIVNIVVALTLMQLQITDSAALVTQWLWITGAILMPLVCVLSAWMKPLRNLFALPVIALITAVGMMIWLIVSSGASVGISS